MPRGHSLSIHARFSEKRRTSPYNSREKPIIITSKHGTTIFSHCNLFLAKLKEKLARKARVHTEGVYWGVLMPHGHPTILLKSK